MKVAITTHEEISSLMKFLSELETLYKYELKHYHFEDIDLSDYEILQKFDNTNPEQFLSDVLEHLSEIHFQRILTNADTLLTNCADLEKDTLDFSPDIKKGLELLEALEE